MVDELAELLDVERVPGEGGRQRLRTALEPHLNEGALPQDIFGVEVSAGFSLDVVFPAVPVKLGTSDRITISMSTFAPDAGGRDGTLAVQGPRDAVFGLAVDALANGSAPKLRVDRGCNNFGGVDREVGERCAMALINTGAMEVALTARSVEPQEDFSFGGVFEFPIDLPARAGAWFAVVAQPTADLSVPRRSTGQVSWTAGGEQLTLPLDATFADPDLIVQDNGECAAGGTFATCSAFSDVPRSSATPAVRLLRLHNNGDTEVALDAVDAGESALIDVRPGELVPFLLGPHEIRTLPLLAFAIGAGTGDFTEQVQLVDEGSRTFSVAVSGTVSP